jgi:hypothetical protein
LVAATDGGCGLVVGAVIVVLEEWSKWCDVGEEDEEELVSRTSSGTDGLAGFERVELAVSRQLLKW